MLKQERQALILKILSEKEFAKVEDLTKELLVSEVTVRRDINELASMNKLIKVHGGAQKIHRFIEDTDLKIRSSQNIQAKELIAKRASPLIPNNGKIYLDAGTTCSAIIPYLNGKNIIVYTHGIHHLEELLESQIETHLIGGKVKNTTLATVGSLSYRYLKDMSFDLAFVGFNAYHDNFGYSTPDENEAILKEIIIQQSKQVYFVGDKSKLGKKAGIRFATKEDGILINDN